MKIDIGKNIEYYSKPNKYACSCDPCKNFVISIKSSYPELHAFLSSKGIDSSKPFETMWFENRRDETIEYYAQYIVFGECSERYEERLDEKLEIFKTTIHPTFICDDRWFVISTSLISLKWNLDISFDESFEITRILHKNIKNDIRQIINEWDPIGLIEIEAPNDEYTLEIEDILKIETSKDIKQISQEIQKIFIHWFGVEKPIKECLKVAKKIKKII